MPQRTGSIPLETIVQRMIDAGESEENIATVIQGAKAPAPDPQAASRDARALELNKAMTPPRRMPMLSAEDEQKYGPRLRQFDESVVESNRPQNLLKGIATLIPGGLGVQALGQAAAGTLGRKLESGRPTSASEDVMSGLADAALPIGAAGLQRTANYLGPKLQNAGLGLLKSVLKVRDPVAKLASDSKGGTDLDAGVNQVVRGVAEAGLGAPSAKNRTQGYANKTAAGEAVERAALIPPERPVGITRRDRLLPSHATGVEDIPLGAPPVEGSTMVVSPQRMRLSDIRYQEGTGPGRPGDPSATRGGFQGDQVPSFQYLGEGGREGVAAPNVRGPGVLRREVSPEVIPGQPFDTVARKDILRGINADIQAAHASASPTTGLEALRARWEIMPEYVDRATARQVVKGINMRLAPRYHNALNDPVAVASEKGVARTVNATMRTPAMEEANEAYGLAKPVALAVSHAAKRAGARDIIGLKGAMYATSAANAGNVAAGLPGAIMGGLGGLAATAASHPIPQGHMGQASYNLGKALPGAASTLTDPDLVRKLLLQMLQQ
jgi:hypothetical protein